MRPQAIRIFELLYFGAIALVLANAVRDYNGIIEAAGGDLTRRGLDPDTLLIASIAFVVGIMLLLWFLAARLRVGFVRYVLLAVTIWQAWELAIVVSDEKSGSVLVAGAAVALQAVAVAFTFLPSAQAWYRGDDFTAGDDF